MGAILADWLLALLVIGFLLAAPFAVAFGLWFLLGGGFDLAVVRTAATGVGFIAAALGVAFVLDTHCK